MGLDRIGSDRIGSLGPWGNTWVEVRGGQSLTLAGGRLGAGARTRRLQSYKSYSLNSSLILTLTLTVTPKQTLTLTVTLAVTLP